MNTLLIKSAKRRLRKNPYLYYFLKNTQYKLQHFRHKNYLTKKLNAILSDAQVDVIPKKVKIPKVAMAGITNICNLNCLMCQTNMSKRPKGFMSLDTFEKLLQRLQDINIDSLGISIQGEPFLHENLEGILEIAERYGFSVWLSTNGQFPEKIESIHSRFSSLISYYRFSIDGATQKTYENIRQGASFDKLIESLETVHTINRGRKDSRIKLYINTVLSMMNIFELKQFFEVFGKYCHHHHMDFILIDSVAPDSTYFWQVFPYRNLLRNIIPCYRPFKFMNFTHSGKLTLCCEDYNDELVIGDFHNDSIEDIWNSQKAELVRKKHLNSDIMDISICQKCYRPYKFVILITNMYIHFLYDLYPAISNNEFGNKIRSFLKSFDEIMKKPDLEVCKEFIFEAFDRAPQ